MGSYADHFKNLTKQVMEKTRLEKEKQMEEKEDYQPQIKPKEDQFKPLSEIKPKIDNNIDLINIDKLIPFKDHPFKLYDKEKQQEMVESIKSQGVIIPIIARIHPTEKGCYEILSGHNRTNCGKLAGLTTIPTVIKNVNDIEASIIVTESNYLQRSLSDMKPSEIGKSLQLHYHAIKQQGKRTDLIKEIEDICNGKDDDNETDLTSRPVVAKLNKRNIQRYIRLNYLNNYLVELVDIGDIKIRPAVDISFLSTEHQAILVSVLQTSNYKIDMNKALKLKEYSREDKLTEDTTRYILSGAVFDKKEKNITSIKLPIKKINQYIDFENKTSKEIQEYIIDALKEYTPPKEKQLKNFKGQINIIQEELDE